MGGTRSSSEVREGSAWLLNRSKLARVGGNGLGRDTLRQAADVVPTIPGFLASEARWGGVAPRVLTLCRPR